MRFGHAHRAVGPSTQTKSRTSVDVHVNLLKSQIEQLRANGITAQSDAQESSKLRYDQSHRPISFGIGDLVEVRARSRKSKLADKFDRIAKIKDRDNDIYTLVDVKTGTELQRHVSKIKKHIQTTVNLIKHYNNLTMKPEVSFLQQLAIACVVAIVAVQTTSGINFETPKASFVTWKEEKINVLQPKKEFEIKVFFTDPCHEIKRQFPGGPSEVPSIEYDHTQTAYHQCSNSYDTNIIEAMDGLVNRFDIRARKTRSVPLLGLIGGVWFSNVIDSVFNDNAETALRENNQYKLLEDLNRRQNYSTEAIVELAHTQNMFLDKVNQLYTITDNNARELIRLQFALNRVSSHVAAKKAAIEKIRFELINGKKLSLQGLNALLDTTVFENIDSDTLEFVSIDRIGRGYLFRFYGHEIDEKMRVYKVNAMSQWVNLTESPSTFMSYDGPSRVLVNIDNDCVQGLDDLEPDTLAQGCITKNGRSPNLDRWKVERYENPFEAPAPTSYITILPNVNVYCLGRKISIKNDAEIDCPPYPIAIPASASWRTSDKSFSGLHKTTLTFVVTQSLPETVVPARIQDPNATKFIETDALKKIHNLTALLELEKRNSFVLNTPVGGISYSVWNKILMCSVGCCACMLFWFWRHNHQTINRHHERIFNTIKLHFGKSGESGAYPELPSVDKELEEKQNTIISFIKRYNKQNNKAEEPDADHKASVPLASEV